jgi:predicted transposase YdaD
MRKGMQKGRKNTARNLLSLDILTEEQIAQAAELSVEEIRQLKREAESASAGGDEV